MQQVLLIGLAPPSLSPRILVGGNSGGAGAGVGTFVRRALLPPSHSNRQQRPQKRKEMIAWRPPSARQRDQDGR